MYVANSETAQIALKAIEHYQDKDLEPVRRIAIIHAANEGCAYMPLVTKWSDDSKKYRRDQK